MTSREPIDADAVNAMLGDLRGDWQISTVSETQSTNADLLSAATMGTLAGRVLVAEYQTAGRGRLDRQWTSPVGAGLTFSVLLRPTVDIATWGWIPLLAGLALAETIGPSAVLKWPNDVLLGDGQRKVAGLLAQSANCAVVVGIGLNVSTTPPELPVPTATSLAIEGVHQQDRASLLAGFLIAFGRRYDAWQAAAGNAERSGLAADYRARCATLGSAVSAELMSHTIVGMALDIASNGELVVQPNDSAVPVIVAAGDITHLRGSSG